jgi:hypothetical protein
MSMSNEFWHSSALRNTMYTHMHVQIVLRHSNIVASDCDSEEEETSKASPT